MDAKTLQAYKDTVDEIKRLTTVKSNLREGIINEMSEAQTPKTIIDGYAASVSRRVKVKYDLEGLEHHLLHLGFSADEFSKTSVDLAKVEELIASGALGADEVARFAEMEESYSLIVKED